MLNIKAGGSSGLLGMPHVATIFFTSYLAISLSVSIGFEESASGQGAAGPSPMGAAFTPSFSQPSMPSPVMNQPVFSAPNFSTPTTMPILPMNGGNPQARWGAAGNNPSHSALEGIRMVNNSAAQIDVFTLSKGPTDGIVIRVKSGSEYTSADPHTITLTSGTVLASVRHPSKATVVHTPVGDVSVSAGADVLVSFNNGIMRVRNLNGRGNEVKIGCSSTHTGNNALYPAFQNAKPNGDGDAAKGAVDFHNQTTGDTGYWSTDANGAVTGFHDFHTAGANTEGGKGVGFPLEKTFFDGDASFGIPIGDINGDAKAGIVAGAGHKEMIESSIVPTVEAHTFKIAENESPRPTDRVYGKIIQLAPGFEFVLGAKILGRSDLRPPDGTERTSSQTLDKGQMAVTAFSVQSALAKDDLLQEMALKPANSKETQILHNISKSAAARDY